MRDQVVKAVADASQAVRQLLQRTQQNFPGEARDILARLSVAEAAARAVEVVGGGVPPSIFAIQAPHGTGIVPNLAVIAPATAQSAPFNIRWSFMGQTVAMIVGLTGAAAALGTQDLYSFAMREISIQLTINGRELPFMDGQSASFKQFYSTSPPQGSQTQWPFFRRFASQETWQLVFRTTANFPAGVTPYVEFPFLRDDLGV